MINPLKTHSYPSSCDFRKLAIYPNGNKTKGVADYMSVYVVMARENFLHPGLEVHAVFRMFLLDQNRDNYLTLPGMLPNPTQQFRDTTIPSPVLFDFNFLICPKKKKKKSTNT